MTFGETLWLVFGALLGGLATYAIPLGMSLIERVMRAGTRGDGTPRKGPTAGIF